MEADRTVDIEDCKVVGAAGEEDMPDGEGRQVLLDDGEFVGVVEEEEIAGVGCEPGFDRLVGVFGVLSVLLGQIETDGDVAIGGVEGDFAIGRTPEDGVVVISMAIGILDGGLGLADTSQPRNGLGERNILILSEGLMQALEYVLPSGEEDVALVRQMFERSLWRSQKELRKQHLSRLYHRLQPRTCAALRPCKQVGNPCRNVRV